LVRDALLRCVLPGIAFAQIDLSAVAKSLVSGFGKQHWHEMMLVLLAETHG